MSMNSAFSHRLARREDVPALSALMAASIRELQRDFLSPQAVEASFDVMGLDTQLIDDGTYFVVECADIIAGCGGWSRRATLFGGDHAAKRDAALLDPKKDAARVRAMYTSRPSFAAASAAWCWACANARPRRRDLPGRNLPRPWPEYRSTGPAATTTSSASRRTRAAASAFPFCAWASGSAEARPG
jgi:hypothetical protein